MFAAENKARRGMADGGLWACKNTGITGLVGGGVCDGKGFVRCIYRSVGGWVGGSVGGWVGGSLGGCGGVHTLIEHAWAPSPGNTNHVCLLRSLNLSIGASTPQPDSPTDDAQMDQRDRTLRTLAGSEPHSGLGSCRSPMRVAPLRVTYSCHTSRDPVEKDPLLFPHKRLTNMSDSTFHNHHNVMGPFKPNFRLRSPFV